MKNWVGDKNSVYKIIGASNHTNEEREVNDYYATDPKDVRRLLEVESFNEYIVECAVGGGHIARELWTKKHIVVGFDIVQRDHYPTIIKNFLELEELNIGKFDIISNPPLQE